MNNNRSVVISQSNPKANYLANRSKIDAAVQRVLESGWYILGREVEAFEQEFSAYIGVRHGIGVGNGTDALELALRACCIEPGDLVFTVSHTAVATVAAIEMVGAIPVLVDIDPVTFTMDPNSLETALNRVSDGTPKAVIPVHLYGHPADMPSIISLGRRFGLYVIEDCAQSHGASFADRMTGSWGDIAAFSFYPTKNLGALGDGGMVVTDNSELAQKARSIRQYGWRQRNFSEIIGMNSRLDELQAAVLRVKLDFLDQNNAQRKKIAGLYLEKLANTSLILPFEKTDCLHAYHQYVIRCSIRDSLKICLSNHGIETSIHYPIPVHLQPAFLKRQSRMVTLEHTEKIANEILSLPMYPELAEENVDTISNFINRWISNS